MEDRNHMDQLEKVEKLRERADVSYEEARAALEANGWDMLDAMVALERAGKTKGPAKGSFTTSTDEQEGYVKVQEKVEERRTESEHPGKSFREVIRRFIRVCLDNSFCVDRHNERMFQIPLIVFVIVLLWGWKIVNPVMIVALFFGVRYSFEGRDELKGANDFMNTAGNMADSFKEGFENGGRKE